MTRRTGPTAKVVELVKARDDGNCLRCGHRAVDIQHRIGRGAGGTRRLEVNSPAALVSLCRVCHDWCERHERDRAYLTGWAIRRSDKRPPSTISLMDLYGRELFLLDDGRVTYTEAVWPDVPEWSN